MSSNPQMPSSRFGYRGLQGVMCLDKAFPDKVAVIPHSETDVSPVGHPSFLIGQALRALHQ